MRNRAEQLAAINSIETAASAIKRRCSRGLAPETPNIVIPPLLREFAADRICRTNYIAAQFNSKQAHRRNQSSAGTTATSLRIISDVLSVR